jgi:cytochrome d ubiquinol oxidase subunit II
MSRPDLVLGAMLLVSLYLYFLFGGADFGGGVWDLFARGPRRKEQRALVSDAIAPVWEVNHVWLIFAVVLLFSGFPRAFSAISIALHVPLTLFLLGVVLRGAAFAFRSADFKGDQDQRRWRSAPWDACSPGAGAGRGWGCPRRWAWCSPGGCWPSTRTWWCRT